MTDWTAFNPTGTPTSTTITGGFNLAISGYIAPGTDHILANLSLSTLENYLTTPVSSIGFG